MRLLERLSEAESAGAAVFGAGNAAYFAALATGEPRPARRGAAGALALANLALAAESAFYLAALPSSQGVAQGVSALVASTAALAATLFLFALTLRARRGGRR